MMMGVEDIEWYSVNVARMDYLLQHLSETEVISL